MNIFCVDAETNGLYGEVFAIGVVVADESGSIIESFSGMACIQEVDNPWVLENVLPNLTKLPEYDNRFDLLEAFWSFWMKYKDSCVCVADAAYPVEAGLFRKCVSLKPDERSMQGPFPLHDLCTMLLSRGIDPMIPRFEFSGFHGKRHNPLDDAYAACICWLKCLKMCNT